ncbi:MAG: single-stranded-DNA-specific exonuclease RecJ, partial [Anaerolineales bacterium]
MTKWLEPKNIPIPGDLSANLDLHPFVLQSLVQRGITDLASAQTFLDPQHYAVTSAFELPNLESALIRIERAIHQGEIIAVWGDFDVDGQTSTTVLVEGLRKLGARVIYHIPIRDTESHGVNIPQLEKLVKQDASLILTCDTGISAVEAIQWANSHGIDFIVTDHHDLPAELPPTNHLINPKFLPSGHPLSSLPGVGVAYKLIEALFQKAGLTDEWNDFQDLAALGIIADIAQLSGDTRFLAQRGIEILRQNKRLGLRILLQDAEINPQMITEEHISFGIAPRLNAVGRLGDANSIVRFFTTQEEQIARQIAYDIEGFNEQRKRLTEDVFQGALYQLENNRSLLDHAALVLYHPNWHAGVLGIVASRLVERFGKPVILLCGTPEQGARGSARSIEGVHITNAIA